MIEYLLQVVVAGWPWQMIGIAFAIGVAIVSLSFIVGEALSNSSIKAFAKAETGELAVSAIILLIVYVLATPGSVFDKVAEGFMLSGVPPTQVCEEWKIKHGPFENGRWRNGNIAYGHADYFLGCRPGIITSSTPPFMIIGADGVIMRKLTFGYMSLMMTEVVIGLLSGLSTGLRMPIIYPFIDVSFGIAPWIAMVPISDIHTLLVDVVGAALGSIMAQKILLTFIEENALTVFMPIGLILRAFPFTRKTGSTILAVAFAGYFIYPISILINQQIWEMIANPMPQPGGPACLTNGQPCTSDDECCSRNCRYEQGGSKVCTTPLTDFREYSSIFSLCYGKSADEINEALKQAAQTHDRVFLEVYGGGSASNEKWTKTEKMMEDAKNELARRMQSIGRNILLFAFPLPPAASVAMFKEIEILIMDAMQFTIMSMLFLVIEIIITMTLLKDFAILIGGEPRVFGISKLV
ncbi:MAG: hypothetical protein N3G80_00720 [Candidatus Micrarchaeota archaeon]|nr:hypothetical protein [Candidatus Micrarchaeota archaeon]